MPSEMQPVKLINLKPLKGKNVFHLISLREPTERRILWIIRNRKEAFNPSHMIQFIGKNKELLNPETNFSKAYKILDSLQLRGFIKQDKEMNWKVTFTGQLYRFKEHPLFALFAWVFSALIALTFFILNHNFSSKEAQKVINMPVKEHTFDSALKLPAHALTSDSLNKMKASTK